MKNKKSIAILMAAITLASCQSYKKVPYLKYNADELAKGSLAFMRKMTCEHQ